MIKETTENLYHFIVSQLPRKYGDRNQRVLLNDSKVRYYTTLILNKGPGHYLVITYQYDTRDFVISLRKPQGYVNEVIIRKYA